MQKNKTEDEIFYFNSLANIFSRATGLTVTIVKVGDERLPGYCAGENIFSLPLLSGDKLWGYVICDHHKARDSHHRSAAIRLLYFIVNNISAGAEKKEKQAKQKDDFYYAKKSPQEIKLTAALRYIDEHLYEALSLESVAAHVCLSANYFSRFFKKHQGVNFKVWVNQKKMQRAGELLGDPANSIESVARRLQFAQTRYFCRLFRAAHRTSPQSFRYRRD